MRLSNSPYETSYTLLLFAGCGFSTIMPYSIITSASFNLKDPLFLALLLANTIMFFGCVSASVLRLTPSVAANKTTKVVAYLLLLCPPFGTGLGIYYFVDIRKKEQKAWDEMLANDPDLLN